MGFEAILPTRIWREHITHQAVICTIREGHTKTTRLRRGELIMGRLSRRGRDLEGSFCKLIGPAQRSDMRGPYWKEKSGCHLTALAVCMFSTSEIISAARPPITSVCSRYDD